MTEGLRDDTARKSMVCYYNDGDDDDNDDDDDDDGEAFPGQYALI